MSEKQLEKRVARLEFIHDQLEAELLSVDVLLRKVGFSQGLETVKAIAHELVDSDQQMESR